MTIISTVNTLKFSNNEEINKKELRRIGKNIASY